MSLPNSKLTNPVDNLTSLLLKAVYLCKVMSVMSDSAMLQTVACQALLSMGFSKQEYWSGLPYPPPGDLPAPGVEPVSLMFLALAGMFFTISATMVF